MWILRHFVRLFVADTVDAGETQRVPCICCRLVPMSRAPNLYVQ